MTDNEYRAGQIDRVLSAGPADDEQWFRIRVSGAASTHHLNVTAHELRTIREALR